MFCNKCGTQVDEGSSFCTKCGNPIGNVAPAAAHPGNVQNGNNKNPLVILLAVLGGLLVILIVVLIVVLGSSGSAKKEPIYVGQKTLAQEVAQHAEQIVEAAPVRSRPSNQLVDPRDGQVYRITSIGNQLWMAQNLNYNSSDSWCMADDCSRYGRLYTWNAARLACPSGWHLPSKREYETLWRTVGGEWQAGVVLKATTGWGYSGNGRDTYGFAAIPGGYIGATGAWNHARDRADFWTSTEYNDSKAYDMDIYGETDAAKMAPDGKGYGFSVRCVKLI